MSNEARNVIAEALHDRAPWVSPEQWHRTVDHILAKLAEAELLIVEWTSAGITPDGWCWKAGDESVHLDMGDAIKTAIVMPHSAVGEAQLVYTKNPDLLGAALISAGKMLAELTAIRDATSGAES